MLRVKLNICESAATGARKENLAGRNRQQAQQKDKWQRWAARERGMTAKALVPARHGAVRGRAEVEGAKI